MSSSFPQRMATEGCFERLNPVRSDDILRNLQLNSSSQLIKSQICYNEGLPQQKQHSKLSQLLSETALKLLREGKNRRKQKIKKEDSSDCSDSLSSQRSSLSSEEKEDEGFLSSFREKVKVGKNKSGKQKQQHISLRLLMSKYMNVISKDKFQLNQFRDEFVSERAFFKLRSKRSYKTLFRQTLILLLGTLAKFSTENSGDSTSTLFGRMNGVELQRHHQSIQQQQSLQVPREVQKKLHAFSEAQLSHGDRAQVTFSSSMFKHKEVCARRKPIASEYPPVQLSPYKNESSPALKELSQTVLLSRTPQSREQNRQVEVFSSKVQNRGGGVQNFNSVVPECLPLHRLDQQQTSGGYTYQAGPFELPGSRRQAADSIGSHVIYSPSLSEAGLLGQKQLLLSRDSFGVGDRLAGQFYQSTEKKSRTGETKSYQVDEIECDDEERSSRNQESAKFKSDIEGSMRQQIAGKEGIIMASKMSGIYSRKLTMDEESQASSGKNQRVYHQRKRLGTEVDILEDDVSLDDANQLQLHKEVMQGRESKSSSSLGLKSEGGIRIHNKGRSRGAAAATGQIEFQCDSNSVSSIHGRRLQTGESMEFDDLQSGGSRQITTTSVLRMKSEQMDNYAPRKNSINSFSSATHKDHQRNVEAAAGSDSSCNHTGCNKECAFYKQQQKGRNSYFFKSKQRDHVIIPDITQTQKRAKPLLAIGKNNYDIITNTKNNFDIITNAQV